MRYRLFIDDDALKSNMETWRSPPPDEKDWIVARSSIEAIAAVKLLGIPSFLQLDHDLGIDENGNTDTTMDFLKWLSEEHPDAIDKIEGYAVHSKNYNGAADIDSFMKSWKRSREL